jgi:hypothetical protein
MFRTIKVNPPKDVAQRESGVAFFRATAALARALRYVREMLNLQFTEGEMASRDGADRGAAGTC